MEVSDANDPVLFDVFRLSGGEVSRISGDDELFELDLSEVDDEDGEYIEDSSARESLDVAIGSGRYARFFHVLLLLYRRVFSNRFLRLCSDITCDRMRLSVSSLEPFCTVWGSELTQNRGDLPAFDCCGCDILSLSPSLSFFAGGSSWVGDIAGGAY